MRIGYRPHFTLAPILIAKAESLYAEEGLDAELVPVDGVASSIPALLRGDLDVLPGPVTPSLFNAIARGARIRIVGDKGQYFGDDCPQSALVISRAFAKRGGVPRRVSSTKETLNQMFVDSALRSKGINPDAVEQVHIPKAAEYEAIVSGRLDAAHIGGEWLARAVKGGAVQWVSANALLAGDQYSVIAYGPRLLDREPDVGRRVALAHLKAMRRYNEGKTPRNLAVVAAALGIPPDELRDVCWTRMREDGMIDTTSTIAFERWARAHGDLDTVLPADSFWDARFVTAAQQALARSP